MAVPYCSGSKLLILASSAEGKIYRKPGFLALSLEVSCRFPLRPTLGQGSLDPNLISLYLCRRAAECHQSFAVSIDVVVGTQVSTWNIFEDLGKLKLCPRDLLRWASGSLKQDVSVAVEAVKQDGTALQVVSEVWTGASFQNFWAL